jgi:hypothetical protein
VNEVIRRTKPNSPFLINGEGNKNGVRRKCNDPGDKGNGESVMLVKLTHSPFPKGKEESGLQLKNLATQQAGPMAL